MDKELRVFVVTVAKKFGPLVKCCSTWLLEDVVLLQETQSAHISGGVVWGTPVPDVPGDGVRDQCAIFSLQFRPDVTAKGCLARCTFLSTSF